MLNVIKYTIVFISRNLIAHIEVIPKWLEISWCELDTFKPNTRQGETSEQGEALPP